MSGLREDVPPPTFEFSDDDEPSEADETDGVAPEDTFPCPHCSAPIPEIGMANFSFNKPAGACPPVRAGDGAAGSCFPDDR